MVNVGKGIRVTGIDIVGLATPPQVGVTDKSALYGEVMSALEPWMKGALMVIMTDWPSVTLADDGTERLEELDEIARETCPDNPAIELADIVKLC